MVGDMRSDRVAASEPVSSPVTASCCSLSAKPNQTKPNQAQRSFRLSNRVLLLPAKTLMTYGSTKMLVLSGSRDASWSAMKRLIHLRSQQLPNALRLHPIHIVPKIQLSNSHSFIHLPLIYHSPIIALSLALA